MNRWAAVIGLGLLVVAAGGAWLSAPPTVEKAVPDQQLVVDPAADLTPAEIRTGDDLSSATAPWAVGAVVVGLAVPAVIGFTAAGARFSRRIDLLVGGRSLLATVIVAVALIVVVRALTLPFAARVRSVRLDAGLATQSWWGWWRDAAVSLALTAVVVAVAVVVLHVAMTRAPVTWWGWCAAAAGIGVVIVTFLQPLIIEPLFNRFTPLAAGPLRSSLMELADQEGVLIDDVLVADASRRTTTLNAYVSGLGSSRRVVVYDTLLDGATDAEVRTVVAHELGHVREDDVPRAALLGGLAVAGVVALLGAVLSSQRLQGVLTLDVSRPATVVAFSLAFVLLAVALATPVAHAMSRRVEAQADVRALGATQDPLAFVSMQRTLAVAAKSDVTPSVPLFFWFGTHPTAPQRIGLARAWALDQGLATVPSLASTWSGAAGESR